MDTVAKKYRVGRPFVETARLVASGRFGQSDKGVRDLVYALPFPAESVASTPGQFVMVKAPGLDPLLPRPLSIARVFADPESGEARLELVVQVVGKGTQALADAPLGSEVVIWGPLGRGFTVNPEIPTVCVAGGVGLAPFWGLADVHPKPENLSIFFGCRESVDPYPFWKIADKAPIFGFPENEPGDREEFLGAVATVVAELPAEGIVLACGPKPLLKFVQQTALHLGKRCEISLENRMACGVGACLGCVQPVPNGLPVTVCRQGPVFRAQEVTL